MCTINNANELKLKDLGSIIRSDKIHVIITDCDNNEIYSGINPFKSSINPLGIQHIYAYMNRIVTNINIESLNSEDKYCFKITIEPKSLFYTIEKTLKFEPIGRKCFVSIYKDERPIKTKLKYTNNPGEFNIDKVPGISIYKNYDVKKIHTSYTDRGMKEISFYI